MTNCSILCATFMDILHKMGIKCGYSKLISIFLHQQIHIFDVLRIFSRIMMTLQQNVIESLKSELFLWIIYIKNMTSAMNYPYFQLILLQQNHFYHMEE